jgi:DNA-binding cell septation regulator SpoVG
MHISIEWFKGKYPQFNVSLASAEGREPFLVIKGCRIVDGSKGSFVSWPATKNEKTGKYWNHVYASDAFAAKVLEEAALSKPGKSRRDADSAVPF